MELSKKTTILLSEKQHQRLKEIARKQKTSLGELIRRACDRAYGDVAIERKRAAVRRMRSMNAPVDSVEVMKAQSIPDPDDYLP